MDSSNCKHIPINVRETSIAVKHILHDIDVKTASNAGFVKNTSLRRRSLKFSSYANCSSIPGTHTKITMYH